MLVLFRLCCYSTNIHLIFLSILMGMKKTLRIHLFIDAFAMILLHFYGERVFPFLGIAFEDIPDVFAYRFIILLIEVGE